MAQFLGAGNSPSDPSCTTVPRTTCRTAGAALFLYQDGTRDSGDKLIFKWNKGQPTSQREFADPTLVAQYDLCVYAGSLLLEANVPPSASWKVVGTRGYKYKSLFLVRDGTQRILLKGSDRKGSKVFWKGKGEHLPDLPANRLPIDSAGFPVVVQVVSNSTGVCFEASFDRGKVKKNTGRQLKLQL